MRYFVSQSIKRGRCADINQYYKSTFSDEIFFIFSKHLDAHCKKCEIIEKQFEDTNNNKKSFETEFDSQFEDYRVINQDKKAQYVNDKLSKLPIHEKIRNLNHINIMLDFDATSLYPSAMWDIASVYPKKESDFGFGPHMNSFYVEVFENQTYNQDGNENAILKNVKIHLISNFNIFL